MRTPRFPPHCHNFFEIIFITKGGLYVSVDDTVYEAECGDIIMINSGIIHSFFDTKPKTAVFGIQFAITFFDESFIDLRDIIFQNTVIGRNRMVNTLYVHICRLLQEVFREYHQKAIGYQLAIKSKLNELMLVLLRGIPKVEHKKPSTKSKHIYDFILKNYDNPDLTLEAAAGTLNLNMFYFAHIFKKYMGYSFHSYLTTTRVNFAKRYLIETKMSITDVAFRSGFNSLQTFNRVFKALTGYTPGNYRQENASG
jgi:AraC-like DNA-binding protein